eukprot:5157394-Amphidinium_carterae.1
MGVMEEYLRQVMTSGLPTHNGHRASNSSQQVPCVHSMQTWNDAPGDTPKFLPRLSLVVELQDFVGGLNCGPLA